MSRVWLITIDAFDGLPPGPNDRLHWRRRAALVKMWRQRVWRAVYEARIPPMALARVSIRLHTLRGPAQDPDNLEARCKPLWDGLVGCTTDKTRTAPAIPLKGILADDTPAHLIRGEVVEVRGGDRVIEMAIERL